MEKIIKNYQKYVNNCRKKDYNKKQKKIKKLIR